MQVCDAHGARGLPELDISPGDGRLFNSEYMENVSPFPRMMVDRDESLMKGMGIDRHAYAMRAKVMRGNTPWLICAECVPLLHLKQADLDEARDAATRWWTRKSGSGHYPGLAEKQLERDALLRQYREDEAQSKKKRRIRWALALGLISIFAGWVLAGGAERIVSTLSWFSDPIHVCRESVTTDLVFGCASCLRNGQNFVNVRSGACIGMSPGQQEGKVLNACPPSRDFSIVPEACK